MPNKHKHEHGTRGTRSKKGKGKGKSNEQQTTKSKGHTRGNIAGWGWVGACVGVRQDGSRSKRGRSHRLLAACLLSALQLNHHLHGLHPNGRTEHQQIRVTL
jgi:hypothetical protein